MTSFYRLIGCGLNKRLQFGNVDTWSLRLNSLSLSLTETVTIAYYSIIEGPVKEGYLFDGWYLDEDFSQPFLNNHTNHDMLSGIRISKKRL